MVVAFRSIEEALIDLVVAQQRAPTPHRDRIIEVLQAEIRYRKAAQASSGAWWKIAPTESGLAV